MSTKYQWLLQQRFADKTPNSPHPSFLTEVAKRLLHSFKQRTAIPVGWHILKKPKPPATGTLVLLLLASLFWTQPASAALIISEVFPAPESGEQEWVEIHNNGSESQSLANWYLEDRLSSTSVISTLGEIILHPGQYLQIVLSSNKLNNSGDAVYLYNQNAQQIDQMTYHTSQTGKSWSKIETENESTWQLTNPTPNQPPKPNITIAPMLCTEPSPSPSNQPSPSVTTSPSPTPTNSSNVAQPHNIYISAVMACPNDNDSEYVEVFNATSTPLTTEGWYILDAANNKRFLLTDSQPAILPANSFTTISFSSTFINNAGETLFVYATNNQLVQTIELPSCETKGIGFTQQGSEWIQQTTNTSSKNDETTATDNKTDTTGNTASSLTPIALPPNQATTSSVLGATAFNPNFPALKLDVPESTTQLFKEPIPLLRDSITQYPFQGIIAIIGGGLLISTSTSYKLLQNLAIL